MKELREYRTKLIARFKEATEAFRRECRAVEDPYAPVEEHGWNVHQIAVHTRDVDKLVYGLRARRTAAENNPEFPNFDGETYLKEHYDASEPLETVLDSLTRNVEALIEILETLPGETWSRASRHTMLGGGLTLQRWVEKDLAHIEEHLAGVRHRNGK